MWPRANLAILPPDDVLVLDFDDGGVADAWRARYSELREAPCARTPRGGLHLWLRLERPENLKTRVKAASGAIDLRGLGRAYLIVPPSRAAKGDYRWEQALTLPTRLPYVSSALLGKLAPPPLKRTDVDFTLPTEVEDRARRYALGALRSEHHLVAATPEGARNDRLNRAAYALAGYAAQGLLSFEEIEGALATAAHRCGLPETEAVRTIQSGLKAGCQAPRSLPKARLNRK